MQPAESGERSLVLPDYVTLHPGYKTNSLPHERTRPHNREPRFRSPDATCAPIGSALGVEPVTRSHLNSNYVAPY
jgi:hypothetical protein